MAEYDQRRRENMDAVADHDQAQRVEGKQKVDDANGDHEFTFIKVVHCPLLAQVKGRGQWQCSISSPGLPQKKNPKAICTCVCRASIAVSTAARVDLNSSNRFTVAGKGAGMGRIFNPMSSSPSICSMERPNSCDSKAASESKRSISARKSLQSSCSSYLQYISTSGRRCVQVARSAWCEVWDVEVCLRHTS
jgi:hypothetical protein